MEVRVRNKQMNPAQASAPQLPGLPGPLPVGEVLLWQGSPGWRPTARRVIHVHQLAGYFAILLVWSIGSAVWRNGVASPDTLTSLLPVPFALVAMGLLTLFAWLVARTTTYSITSSRVVMHFGVALPMTINLPFRLIDSAAVTSAADGTGDIALTLARGDRMAYLAMWPHVRPWHLSETQPALRGVPDAAGVARILSRALAASAEQPIVVAQPSQAEAVKGDAAHAAAI
jgi:hypothetical protein